MATWCGCLRVPLWPLPYLVFSSSRLLVICYSNINRRICLNGKSPYVSSRSLNALSE